MGYLGNAILIAVAIGVAAAWQDDTDCGQPSRPFTNIVGGQPAEPGEYPWMAAMIINKGRFGCGGTLIKRDWVVTAAHCLPIKSLPMAYDFILGQAHLNGSLGPNAQFVEVGEIYVHPNYTNENQYEWEPDWDIALLKMSEPYNITDYVRTVCVPPEELDSLFFPGVKSTVTGWGATREGGDVSEFLMEVDVSIVNQDECRQKYHPQPITDNMICAGDLKGGMDSCQGDSGGPMISYISDKAYLAGIVSWGEGCARADYPGVYTRVTAFEDWIAPVFDGGEIEVSNDCDYDQFLCTDGWCTNYKHKCNGFFDGCFLGSDNYHCESPAKFYDHMYQTKLTADSIKREVSVSDDNECAQKCVDDLDGCLAFDVLYNGSSDYRCYLAGNIFETEDTDNFDSVHFQIEKFPFPSAEKSIPYIPGRFAAPKWLPAYEVKTDGFVWIIQPQPDNFTEPFTAINIRFSVNHNDGQEVCASLDTRNTVYIRAGSNYASPVVGLYCLNLLPPSVIVPGDVARVEFLSADPTKFGFMADYYGTFACDEEFNTAPGRISSPLYPENYPNDVSCRTLISTGTADQAIILVISNFELEGDGTPDCINDFDTLTIYDSDRADNNRILGVFCGNTYQSYIRSTGPYMYVVFKTDQSVRRRGYQATFNFIPNIPCDETLTNAPDVISSPNYPEDYPSDTICRKQMIAPEGNNVRLTIQDFSLESSDDCAWDYFSIYDSNTGDPDTLLGTYCGTDLSKGTSFESTGSSLLVLFVSDGTRNAKGFQANFKFVPTNETGCDSVIDVPATFSSPNYPVYYTNNLLCQTKIIAPSNQIVFLSMNDFQLEDDYANCRENYDTLSIYDADFPDPNRLLGTYCGTVIPIYFTSTGNSMYVVFKSDVSNARRGFEATVQFMDELPPPVSPPPPLDGSECGRQRVPLQPEINVVGGKAAQEGEWPWQGALYMTNTDFKCGVSLLNENWVITAAHCVDVLNEPSIYSVVMGTNSLLENHPNNTQIVEVADIFINPNFVKFENDYDVALLKMSIPFTLTDYVHPICIPPSEWNYYISAGVECTVTGWGASFSGGIMLSTLYEVDVPLYDQQACIDNYAPEIVSDRMVCAGYPWGGKDACTGDEGGPLVSNVGNQWYLVGVVSWGDACAQQQKPHVYSRITMLEDWIAPIFEGQDPERGDIGVCDADQYQCSDGWCLDYVYKCDEDENSGQPGCYSGSDEMFCDSSAIYFDPFYTQQLTSDSIRSIEEVTTPDECAELCLKEMSSVCLQFDTFGVGPVTCRLGQHPYNFETSTTKGLVHFEMQTMPAPNTTLTAVNGRIAAPKFFSSTVSTSVASYFWMISPNDLQTVGLTTTSFTFGQVHIDELDTCGSDYTTGSYIVLRSGPDSDSPESGKHCLNDTANNFVAEVPSTMTRLEFHTSNELMYGFVADYKIYYSCDKTYDTAPTVISSPNYPENYPNGVTCRTLINAPADFQVLIYLRDIQLEDSGEYCGFDWDTLTIYDSDMEHPQREIAKYCDNDYDTPLSLRSTGSSMLLVFKTDTAVAMAGYEAAFYFLPAVTSTPPPSNTTDACGVQTAILEPEPYIVGGKPAQEGEWPWQTALYLYNRFICGGVLISTDYVLTLARCVQEEDGYDIVLGTNSLEDLSDNLQFRGVSEIYIHPEFDYMNLDHDLALLKLSEPVVITDYVRTVCLPSEDMKQFFPIDTVCTATGWGESSQTGPNNEVLYEVFLPIVNESYCAEAFQPQPITENMLCAGNLDGSSGVCWGDAGGPLVSLYDNQYYLVGVPSFSRGCAEEDIPTLYMRITAFEEWISDVLAGNVTSDVKCDNTFNKAPGEFSSPFYPDNYANNVTCRTLLTAPVGYRVYLSMRYFYIEFHHTCQFDKFTVYDSNTNDPSTSLGTFCGTVVDDYFLSSGRSLYVVFTSDVTTTKKGFDAAFYFLPETGCNKEITEAPGTIMSPLYPNNYPNNVKCTMLLTAPEGKTVILSFMDFQLEDNLTPCVLYLDTLSIYDGDSPDEDNLVGVYCGKDGIPERFQSTGESMVVVFKTDGQKTDKGFEAAYYFIPPTKEPVTVPVTPPLDQPNCGTQTISLDPEINIIGGQLAQEGEWPWQAAIYSGGEFICGGSLLASKWVITTAECVRETEGSTITVAVGTNVHDGFPDTVQTGTVIGKYVHPEFNAETQDFDIALLKMKDEFEMTSYVRTVCIPSASMDWRFDEGSMCMSTGWGARFEGGPIVNDLQEVDLSVQSQSFCMQHYYPDVVTNNMLCAGPLEGGKGVCEGDNGGPLVSRIGNRWYLVGMSSWGRGCGVEFFPSIFTRITAVSDWIAPIFDNKNPDVSPPTKDPLKAIQEELKMMREQSDKYMKAMFGLVAGIVLFLLILIYVAYSYSQQNSHLKNKLDYLEDDSEHDGSGIEMTLPSASTNVYEMSIRQGDGGIDNDGVDIKDETTRSNAEDSATKADTTSSQGDDDTAPADAIPHQGNDNTSPKVDDVQVTKQDMGTDNPEFIKYPKK